MNLKNKRPVMVPDQYCAEIEKCSKAMLMDIVWDLAVRAAGCDEFNGPKIMEEIKNTAEIVGHYRKQAGTGRADHGRRHQKTA